MNIEAPRRIVTYDPAFDRENYINLYKLKSVDPAVYETKKEILNTYTRRQMETNLGERFNVILSKTRFDTRDGKIYSENSEEPFEEMLKRGRDYRRKNGKAVDFMREEAEVIGFGEVIQKKLCDPDTAVGTMMLSISLPGGEESTYQKNFYDVFTLHKDDHGKYIEARRYSSTLDIEKAMKARSQLNPGLPQVTSLSAEHLLANPFEITARDFSKPEDVYRALHNKHEFISEKELNEEILVMSMPAILNYIDDLVKDPFSNEKPYLNLNATLNAADRGKKILLERNILPGMIVDIERYIPQLTKDEIYAMGMLPVREVMTGCGSSGGFSVATPGGVKSENGIFSVSEFGLEEDKFGSREFDCPSCNKKNIRPKDQLIDKCQHCGSSEVSCEAGEGDMSE